MPLKPARDMQGWIEGLATSPAILRWQGESRLAADMSLQQLLESHGGPDSEAAWKDFLLHDHYLWNSARPRHKQATVELRAACQQPGHEHMASAALHLGLVCAADTLRPWLVGQLGDAWWATLRVYHDDAVVHGAAAKEPFEGFVRGVLDRCSEALEDRGRGEARYMQPLYNRLDRGRAPAQYVQQAFDRGGVGAVVELTRIR
jgi:gamma-glutamylcysteine synthetase